MLNNTRTITPERLKLFYDALKRMFVQSVNGVKIDANGNVNVDTGLDEVANMFNYKREQLFTVSRTSVVIPKNTYVKIGNKLYHNSSDITLQLSTAGTNANRAGKDIYVYACTPTDTSSSEPVFVLSMNTTVPTGYTADNSRKIGGFHCLCLNVGTISGHPLSGYTTGDGIDISAWDLLHRPVSEPEGMVWIEGINLWVDIYLPSWDGSKLVSKYGAVICDGGSTKKLHGEGFSEEFRRCGKRPIRRNDFAYAAEGSNENTNITGSADPNTTGGHTDTASRRMISNFYLEDCCGVIWQWGDDLFEYYPNATWTTSNFYLSGYSWQEKSVYNSSFDSAKKGRCNGLLRRVRLGGCWGDGSYCGSRCAVCDDFSADGWTGSSSRGVSEPRVVNL